MRLPGMRFSPDPSLSSPHSLSLSSHSAPASPATSTIRHVLSIFSRLHGFYDTFVAVSLTAAYFTRYILSFFIFLRCKDDFHVKNLAHDEILAASFRPLPFEPRVHRHERIWISKRHDAMVSCARDSLTQCAGKSPRRKTKGGIQREKVGHTLRRRTIEHKGLGGFARLIDLEWIFTTAPRVRRLFLTRQLVLRKRGANNNKFARQTRAFACADFILPLGFMEIMQIIRLAISSRVINTREYRRRK